MYLSNAVYMVRSVYAEGSHLYHVVLDDGHMSDLALVMIHIPKFLAVSLVYLYDDGEDSRCNALEQVAVPFFESFGHYGVVGVSKGMSNDVPSLVPVVAAVIEQYSHQLGDSEGGVSIVDVDSYLIGKVIHSAVNVHVGVYDVAYGSCYEEILLAQTQRLALSVVIVRIKHLSDSLRHDISAKSLRIIALVEHSHIKRGNFRFPKAQLRNSLAVVARNEHIVRYCEYRGVVFQLYAVEIVIPVFFKVAVELNFDSGAGHGNEHSGSAGQPVIGQLGLPAVFQLLLKDAVFVKNGVAGSVVAVGSQRVEVAGSKSSQTAVSERRVLYLLELVYIRAELLQTLGCAVQQIEAQQVIVHRSAYQELH